MAFSTHKHCKLDLSKQIENIGLSKNKKPISFNSYDEVIEKLNDEMIIRGFSSYTFRSYICHSNDFLRYSNQPVSKLDEISIKKYLLHLLKDRKLKNNTVNKIACVLKFLFHEVLHKYLPDTAFPNGKIKKSLPTVLTTDEVEALLNATPNIRNKALLMTAYGCGLRVSEVVKLKVTDIDSKNMRLFIREAKGNKDRYTILPKKVLEILREYYRHCRPNEWLFPTLKANSKKPYITERGASNIFYTAMKKANINKKGCLHILRHSFATHLLDTNENIFTIKELLGHSNIKTTSIYLKLTSKKVEGFTSPIDALNI